MPYVCVGNDAFGLKPRMMNTYPLQNLPVDKRVYNYRLSRARRVVENVFGIAASSDVAKGPAGHAEQDHNIANMSFCKILKNSIHIISMKIKSIGSIHPLTIHSFQFYEVLLTSPVLL